jgi:hypothetical protein
MSIELQLSLADDGARDALRRVVDQTATESDYSLLRSYLKNDDDGRSIVQSALRSMGSEYVLRSISERRAAKGAAGVIREIYTAKIAAMRAQLDSENATTSERLVVEQIVEAWARLEYVQTRYDQYVLDAQDSDAVRFWDKQLTRAQQRYLRAIETLARIRRYEVQYVDKQSADGSQQRTVAIRANG